MNTKILNPNSQVQDCCFSSSSCRKVSGAKISRHRGHRADLRVEKGGKCEMLRHFAKMFFFVDGFPDHSLPAMRGRQSHASSLFNLVRSIDFDDFLDNSVYCRS